VSSATPTAQHQLDHCYRACTGCQSGSGSTSNSPNFVTWLLLSNSPATSLIWSAHTVSLACCDHPHQQIFRIGTVRYAKGLWRMRRHGPVIAHCTDSEDFPFLSVLPHNLDTAARRFSVAAPRLWNSLPLNCLTAPSVNTFKIRLKTFLFDSA